MLTVGTSVKRLLSKTLEVNYRTAGDQARDSRKWAMAEAEYRRHLQSYQDDQPIWVQLGHTLKEQGSFSEAQLAYEQAIDLKFDDADAHLQLGHVLKLAGKLDAAKNAYRKSYELLPQKMAYDEIVALGSISLIEEYARGEMSSDAVSTVYLELDDLLDYLKNYQTVSGIQRVQLGILQYALRTSEGNEQNWMFVRSGKHASGFWRLPSRDLKELVYYIVEGIITASGLISLIETAESHATWIEPSAGQTYFVLGAFWGFGSNAARYTALKVAGVKVGVYIYDLIPITNPEYCSTELVSEFSFALGDGLHCFDFILTISEFVARDVLKYLKKHGLKNIPVAAVPLAHKMQERSVRASTSRWESSIAHLSDRPLVLMVSTIEARKNHIYLYWIWKTLLDEGLNPPDLVFVGRFGWRVNDLRDMLQGTDYLEKRIHILHDISDGALETLYQACLFTAFPSIIEGWGLPVGESLAYGRPCIASNSSSIPEVGGSLVDYIDPWNVHNGLSVFKKMIFDDQYREFRAQEIQEKFVARTWDDVGRDLLIQVQTIRLGASDIYKPPLLATGEILVPGDICGGKPVPSNYSSRPLRPLLAKSWYPSEPFGCWLRGDKGTLWFTSNCTPGTEIVAYMNLIGAPWAQEHKLALGIGKTTKRSVSPIFPTSVRDRVKVYDIKTHRFFCRVSGNVESDGTIYVNFEVEIPPGGSPHAMNPHDDRVFYVGLIDFAFAESSDAGLRLDIIER